MKELKGPDADQDRHVRSEIPEPERANADDINGSSEIATPLASMNRAVEALVERIRSGETDGMKELHQLFSKGVRVYLARRLGPQELEARVHDTFVLLIRAIQSGGLWDPPRLIGFLRTVVQQQVAGRIHRAAHLTQEDLDLNPALDNADSGKNLKDAAIFQERAALIKQVLKEMTGRDREILTRFYLLEQCQDQICSEMALTKMQFRLLKSQAKSRFGEMIKNADHGA